MAHIPPIDYVCFWSFSSESVLYPTRYRSPSRPECSATKSIALWISSDRSKSASFPINYWHLTPWIAVKNFFKMKILFEFYQRRLDYWLWLLRETDKWFVISYRCAGSCCWIFVVGEHLPRQFLFAVRFVRIQNLVFRQFFCQFGKEPKTDNDLCATRSGCMCTCVCVWSCGGSTKILQKFRSHFIFGIRTKSWPL